MRANSKRLIIATFLVAAAGFVPQAQAQSRPITGDEYLRTVSVQARGRSVQGPAEAGVQRVVDIAALPSRRQSAPAATAGFTPQNTSNILNSQSGLSTLHTTRFQAAAPAASNSNSRYPYPAQTPPRFAPAIQTGSGFGGSGTFVNSAPNFNGTNAASGTQSLGTNAAYGTNPAYGTNATFGTSDNFGTNATTNYADPRSVPTGYPNPITPPTGYPPTNYPTTNYPATNYPTTNYPTTNYPTTNYPTTNSAPTTYPPTSILSPNVGAFRQGVSPAPTWGFGPANTANAGITNQTPGLGVQTVGTNVLSPTQIAPQPIYPPAAPLAAPVQLQNLPPGNYQGTGLDGRPVTYVDGQPVRNLFRYIFP